MSGQFPPMDKVEYDYSQQPPMRHPLPDMKYAVPPSQSMYFPYAQAHPGPVPTGQGSSVYPRGDPYSYHRPPPHFNYDPRYVVDGAPRPPIEYRPVSAHEALASGENEFYPPRGVTGFPSEGSSASPGKPWSSVEMNILHAAVTSYAALERPNSGFIDVEALNWEKIASHLPNRTAEDCRTRWEKRNVGVLVRPTSMEMRPPPMVFTEETKLKRPSAELDEADEEKPDKKRQRLNKMKKKAPWTKEEEEIINKMQTELGNKWTIIANKLVNRSSNDVKNYWYSKQRSIMKRTRLPGEVGADDEDEEDADVGETKETEDTEATSSEPKRAGSPKKPES